MSDLLIRDIDPDLKQQLEDRARSHRWSLSEEAKLLLRRGLQAPLGEAASERGLGTAMMQLVRPEDRGDDLVFEIPGEARAPPDFE